MASHFASLLKKMRQERGFPTGYAFYRDNGGRKVFPFTYPYYARFEKGQALPRPAWLPILFASLRLLPAAGGQREFVVAYLRDVFGDDGLFEDIVLPWIRPPEAVAAQKKALRRMMGLLSRNLSNEDFGAVVSSAAAFWSFVCLANSEAPMSAEEIAAVASLPKGRVEAALRMLQRRRLLKRASDGRFSSPLWDKFSVFPTHGPGHDERMRRYWAYVDQAIAKRGATLVGRRALVRAEESDMLSVARELQDGVDGALGCLVSSKGPGTGLFLVETRLERVFPF